MNEKNVNNKKKSSANVLKTENGRHFGMKRRFTRDDCVENWQVVIDGHVILRRRNPDSEIWDPLLWNLQVLAPVPERPISANPALK